MPAVFLPRVALFPSSFKNFYKTVSPTISYHPSSVTHSLGQYSKAAIQNWAFVIFFDLAYQNQTVMSYHLGLLFSGLELYGNII